ncbi:flagellar hook-associated protein FlgL [Cohnella xylanilytica]|uniref:flagellar hook-associated protein FlgL n=1 Tax=Cohnella xylanilytica TaxID=557555 RepID=UPI001B0FB5E8|nr:flagellar hook-associated protein FlgL [Cohnella xylanilytica]GIO12279.1 flagellar hook-associated protein FlgL [Cohnella xylanilytica]
MVGRVTQGTITSQLLRNINTNLSRMQVTQEKMSTGRNINRPSDDPVGITYALRYRSDLTVNERYQGNVDSATSWLDFNDTALSQVGDVLKRIKELAVQGSNGTNPQVALNTVADEMDQLKLQLIDISNSKLNGKYVFNGQKTDQLPYGTSSNITDVVTDSGNIDFTINSGVRLGVNLNGNDVFGYPPTSSTVQSPKYEDDNAFYVIDKMITSLRTGDYKGVSAQLPNLETRMNKVLAQHAEIGAKSNRVELVSNRLSDLNLNLQTLQAKTEDADLEELIIKSKVDENVYQAALSVGAKIISPTLVDFLN